MPIKKSNKVKTKTIDFYFSYHIKSTEIIKPFYNILYYDHDYEVFMNAVQSNKSNSEQLTLYLSNSKCIVCFINKKYSENDNCKNEIIYAHEKKIPMILIMLEKQSTKDLAEVGAIISSHTIFYFYDRISQEPEMSKLWQGDSFESILKSIKKIIPVDKKNDSIKKRSQIKSGRPKSAMLNKTLVDTELPIELYNGKEQYPNGDRYEGELSIDDHKKYGKGIYYFSNGEKYDGSWYNDKRTGAGVYYFNDESKYEGDFVQGNFHGKGTYFFADGDKYTGDWVNGERTGSGVYYFRDGNEYEGEFLNGLKHGKGTYTWAATGEKYTGDWANGERTGKGVYEYVEENRYEGDFLNNKRHGKGTFFFSDGDKYTGDWVNGEMTGKGVYTFANGDRCVGLFSNGKKEGPGTMFYENGDKYVGMWVNGKQTGKGEFFYSDKNRYEGDFVDGKKNGKGIMHMANGERYEGDWVDDVKSGQGVYYFLANQRYEGQFAGDQFHGKGTAYFFDGTRFSGIWENGIVKEKEIKLDQETDNTNKQEEIEKEKAKELETKQNKINKIKNQSSVQIISRQETIYKKERPVTKPIERSVDVKKEKKPAPKLSLLNFF